MGFTTIREKITGVSHAINPYSKTHRQNELLSGLHIGSGNSEIHIGGTDNPVIKPITQHPYIPGSSIKGKMRSLLG